MQNQDTVQLSLFDFNFDEADESGGIENLFTEKDMSRFGKGRKGWSENDISRKGSSEIGIEVSSTGNNVNTEYIYHIESWVDDMIEKLYDLDLNTKEELLSTEDINEWLFTHIVKKRLDSRYVKKYMSSKLSTSVRVFSINIKMFEKVFPIMKKLTNKTLNEFEREDFLNTKYLTDIVMPLSSVERGYYQSFINSLKPFTKVRVNNYVNKTEKICFDHPLVRVVERVLKKERNIKPESFYNNYYGPVQNFVNWAITSLEKFQGQSINTFIFNMVTSENLDYYKSFLIKQVKEEKLTEITAKRNIQYVRGFFQVLFRKKKIVKEVTSNLTNIEADEFFYRQLPSDNEIQDLIYTIGLYSTDPIEDKLALSLMMLMGFRGCEVASLEWKDINLSTRSISITDTKGMDAVLPIPSKVYDLLVLYKSSSDKRYVFCNKPSNFLNDLRLVFNSYQLIAGWDYGGGLHLFRHIYVTRLVIHCPPQIIKSLTRHISDDTVAKYVHLERKFVKNELTKLSYTGGRIDDF
ncbi:site-specific integrase [Rossellomorea vietnamensis]|uniref:Site-specific integrase n=1 Tax=Rossellomorea vietnamensis TaxID=218284 RepID=A0A5D4NJ69_9BACI|nr:site-specific integrase [Rossellomorea vietnamensis]TYS12992.1 site-specific integrase [Rossellomorea vietnamensis]